MALLRRKSVPREDIVSLSLSEIVLFFLFFCLILLGSQLDTEGTRSGTQKINEQIVIIQGLEDDVTDLEGTLEAKDKRISTLIVQIGRLTEENETQESQISILQQERY